MTEFPKVRGVEGLVAKQPFFSAGLTGPAHLSSTLASSGTKLRYLMLLVYNHIILWYNVSMNTHTHTEREREREREREYPPAQSVTAVERSGYFISRHHQD